MVIRSATLDDAEAMSSVLIASITELCEADHGGVAANIATWTANKSPEGVRAWFGNPVSRLFVGKRDGVVVSVGGCSNEGEVLLNYVAPSARFSGASKAMLAHIEGAIRERGLPSAHLTSTATAYAFYLSAGWKDSGAPQTKFGVAAYPMTKSLTFPGMSGESDA